MKDASFFSLFKRPSWPEIRLLKWEGKIATIFKFRKRKKIKPSLVYVLHKTWNFAFSRRSRLVTAKKFIKKKRDVCAEMLFCLFNLLIFWQSLCRRRHGIFKSLQEPINRLLVLTLLAGPSLMQWVLFLQSGQVRLCHRWLYCKPCSTQVSNPRKKYLRGYGITATSRRTRVWVSFPQPNQMGHGYISLPVSS